MLKKLEASKTLQEISKPNSTPAVASNEAFRCCDPSAAARRVRILFGVFRKGEANDPEIYHAGMVHLFCRYPESVVVAVTEPATGLPSEQSFLPTLHEVRKACEAKFGELKRAHEKVERERAHVARAAADRALDEQRLTRPTLAELTAKHDLRRPSECIEVIRELGGRIARQIEHGERVCRVEMELAARRERREASAA